MGVDLRKVLFVAGILSVLMGGTALAATRPLSAAEKAMVSKTVGSKLLDPMSMVIDWVPFKIPTRGEGTGYCVQVNAKNRYGGYVGARQVVVFANWDGKKMTSVRDAVLVTDEGSAGVVQEVCRQLGY